MSNKISVISAALMAVSIVGCSSAPKQPAVPAVTSPAPVISESLAAEQAKSAALQKQLEALRAQHSSVSQVSGSSSDDDLLPPNAKPGECYARLLIPATYKDTTERVTKKQAGYKLEIIPAKYNWVQEKVLVKEASEKLKVIPATYKWAEEKVLVSEGDEKVVTVPAKYRTVKEKILVKPAYSTWKKGRGPIEKQNNATGEIMCLVEIPAEYKTVVREELVSPATTSKVSVPAKYDIIKKRVVAEPEKVVKIPVPAEYKTVKVKKIAQPAREKRIEIPAEYATVTKREKVTESSMEWSPILCETNTTPDIIRRLQSALNRAGFSTGLPDGRIGSRTMDALRGYQRKKGLATGQITMETLKSLNVAY